MCGRYASTRSASDIADEFRAVDATGGQYPGPDYNVAPTKPVLAVVQRHPRDADGTPDPDRTERSVRVLRWGLVPSWAKNPSGAARMINARAETVTTRPAYRSAVRARRALLPATGWYEWQPGTRQPWFVTPSDGSSLALAGLWEFWRPPGGGDPLVTSAVLTTDAVGPLTAIHHRMPLLLAERDWARWLDPDVGADDAGVAALLAPPSAELVAGLELRPVSRLVNNVRNDGPALLERVDPAPSAVVGDAPLDELALPLDELALPLEPGR
jgi:putative SOS response-associated peptidase YedK